MDALRYLTEVMDIINRQAIRKQISIAIICFLLGFLFVTQIKGQMEAERPLQEETEKNLAEIARDLNGELSSLKAEAAQLTLEEYKISRVSDNRKSVLEQSQKTRQSLLILAGKAPVSGRGVRVSLEDAKNKLSGSDLADMVNELRAAGAEAMALNGRRIGVNTSFNRMGEDMYMGDEHIVAPFVFDSIGDPEIIYQALTMAGGIRDTLTSSVPGVSMELRTLNLIKLPAAKERKYDFARSVTE